MIKNQIGNSYVAIYICPNENCSNYYGSTSMGDLKSIAVLAPAHAKDAGEIRHMRSQCPTCGGERQRRWAKILSADDSAEIDRKMAERQPEPTPT